MTTLPLHSARWLWQAFLSARVLVAGLLLALLSLHTWTATGLLPHTPWLWLITCSYMLLAMAGWVLRHHRPPGPSWHWPWLLLLATDVVVICLLQELQPGKLYYTPLLALPILTMAVLGSMRQALATTAGITLMLLGIDVVQAWSLGHIPNEDYMQTALVCAGFFALAYLTRQLSQRLAYQERQARTNRLAAHTQAQVNHLIVTHLEEGVLVVDQHYQVRMANPAACELLGLPTTLGIYDLLHPDWQSLRDLVDQTFSTTRALHQDIHVLTAKDHHIGLHVRTWLTANAHGTVRWPELEGESHDSLLTAHAWLCVMFLHDLREAEARMRTEKMAAMGRMSAAVAHEIRNPLAAIVQANALIAEDLQHPAQLRLCEMVEHNAQRLARIAEEVLDIARVQQQIQCSESHTLALDAELHRIWQEWGTHRPLPALGLFSPQCPHGHVVFDNEHLRRLVVNLLDNAARHCAPQADALQLITGSHSSDQHWLQVWSEAPPLEASVEKHLFEPFFSSQSRSTGLGLYICRELCQRHGASIGYSRCERMTARGPQHGNAFTVLLRGRLAPASTASLFDPLVV